MKTNNLIIALDYARANDFTRAMQHCADAAFFHDASPAHCANIAVKCAKRCKHHVNVGRIKKLMRTEYDKGKDFAHCRTVDAKHSSLAELI